MRKNHSANYRDRGEAEAEIEAETEEKQRRPSAVRLLAGAPLERFDVDTEIDVEAAAVAGLIEDSAVDKIVAGEAAYEAMEETAKFAAAA